MNKEKIQEINNNRMQKWAKKLTDVHATTIIAIGIGHDHNSGQIQIMTIEDDEMDTPTLAAFVKAAYDMLVKSQISLLLQKPGIS